MKNLTALKSLLYFFVILIIKNISAQSVSLYDIRHTTLPNLYSTRNILAAYQDHVGVIWIGSKDGLYILDGDGTVAFSLPGLSMTEKQTIFNIQEDSNNFLWISTSEGLKILDQTRSNLVNPETLNMPYSLLQNTSVRF